MIVAIRIGNHDFYEQRQMTPQEFYFLLKQTPGWVAVKYLGWRTICFNVSYKIISYIDIPYKKYIDMNRFKIHNEYLNLFINGNRK